jgi:hypothetical protein
LKVADALHHDVTSKTKANGYIIRETFKKQFKRIIHRSSWYNETISFSLVSFIENLLELIITSKKSRSHSSCFLPVRKFRFILLLYLLFR